MPFIGLTSRSRSSSADNYRRSNKTIAPQFDHVDSKSEITFIPAQIDELGGTCPSRFRKTPCRILIQELRVMIQNSEYVFDMFRSLWSYQIIADAWDNPRVAAEMALHGILFLVEAFVILMAIPAFLLLPGFIFALYCGLSVFGIAMLCQPFKGARVIEVVQGDDFIAESYNDERWIFINGMLGSSQSLRSQCQNLARVFRRPIYGVHNRTNGLLIDILEFLLQKCLGLNTVATTTLYGQIRDACLNSTVRKVILIGHGQGCQTLSIALDFLHADLPVDAVSKIEIYTFGSMASSLSNPLLQLGKSEQLNWLNTFTRPGGEIVSPVKATLASKGYRAEDTERVITHCEHYAFGNDFWAQCGILHNVCSVLDNRYCGRVFILNEKSGFMMNEHYLASLFAGMSRSSFTWSLSLPSSSPSLPSSLQLAPNSILRSPVSVDLATVEKREFTARGVSIPLKAPPRGRSAFEDCLKNNGLFMGVKTARSVRGHSWGSSGELANNTLGKARNEAKEAEGKSMMTLSRLWRYAEGGRPVGEGVPVINGVGNDSF